MRPARRRLSANGDDVAADHETLYGYDCQLLTATSRPAAVDSHYAAVERSLAPLIGHCDAHRQDGLPGAKVFSPCPTSTRWTDHVDRDSVEHHGSVSTALIHCGWPAVPLFKWLV